MAGLFRRNQANVQLPAAAESAGVPTSTTPEDVFRDAGLAPREPQRRHVRDTIRTVGVIGCAFVGGSFGLWELNNKSGYVESQAPKHPTTEPYTRALRVGTWNMHGQTRTRYKQIYRLMRHYRLAALNLQEVTADDAQLLRDKLPQLSQKFVLADEKQHIVNGGYGNAILSFGPQRDKRSISLQGTSYLDSVGRAILGFGGDVANADSSFKNTKDGLQEKRAAIAVTIAATIDGRVVNFRDITTHISSHLDPKIHDQQMHRFLEFTGANTPRKIPTVVCGDFNANNNEMGPAFYHQNLYMPLTSTPTSTNTKRVIDHCAYDIAGAVGMGDQTVVTSVHTDHNFSYVTLPLRNN